MLHRIYADEGEVSALDRGLSYGDGLFETMRMVGTRAVLRSLHIERMTIDAGRLGIPVDEDDLKSALTEAIDHFSPEFGDTDWVLKLTLTRGVGGRGYRPPDTLNPHVIVSAFTMPPMPAKEGVIARSARFPLTVNPQLAGIKTLNRLDQVMASREFSGEEWELIMADPHGQPLEGTRTNLLARIGDQWVTPPVDSIAVAGVMRQFCLASLRAAGESVAEQALDPDFWRSPEFQGLSLLNSVFGVVPVRCLDSVHLPVDRTLATICDPLKTLE